MILEVEVRGWKAVRTPSDLLYHIKFKHPVPRPARFLLFKPFLDEAWVVHGQDSEVRYPEKTSLTCSNFKSLPKESE